MADPKKPMARQGAAAAPEPANDVSARRPELTPEQEELVRIGLPMVSQCAAEVAYRYHGLVTAAELLTPGGLALQEAPRAYDGDRHPSFPVYARHHVRGRMIDAIRVEHFSLRARVERAMDRAFEVLEAHHSLDVDLFSDTEEEILEGSRKGADEAMAAVYVAHIVEAQGAGPEERVVEAVALHEALATLGPYERAVIERVYQQGMTLDEAADDIGCHPNTAQRRHASGLRKLRAFFAARGKGDG